MNAAFLAITNIVSLFAGLTIGYWQGRISKKSLVVATDSLSTANKSLDVTITKAVPKISTTITIDERYDNGPLYPAFFYLITTIHNDGELPISNLNGQWKLTPSQGVSACIIPISRESLGSSPYQLKPHRISESGASSNARQYIRFDVYIEFEYIGFPDQQPHTYTAKYSYEPNSTEMIRA